MLYDIRLAIVYDYDVPIAASRHVLRMMPRTLPDQTLVAGEVSTDPAPDFRREGTDFFGNATTEIVFDRVQDAARFVFRGRVRRQTGANSFDLSPDLSGLAHEIAGVASLAPDAPHHYLGASDRVRPVPDITAFARESVAGTGSVFQAVRALNTALHDEMTFDPTATEVTTPPVQAFVNRRGVCQDFSHVMIAALRGLGIPAGYVSGFLRTTPPKGQTRLEGADAMHAWVQAWCGAEMGWVQMDPTNDIMAGNDHVVVALGRDYADVAPVKGALRTSGSHRTRHEVDVVPLDPSAERERMP